ncbi:MAG: hypothetical protein KDC98_23405 [Planctomycetes bacterium]|nr:hypothetical protein [Planctomycetota bacterium]
MLHHPPVAICAMMLSAVLSAQVLQPPFAGTYTFTDLGAVPGVPTSYGGVTFKEGNPNKLLIGGAANNPTGAIYEVDVMRDGQGYITGFAGTATQLATAARIDGGLCYGPGGVLFFTTYSNNTLGQIRPGSTSPDRVIQLLGHGVSSSTGTCNFVPPNFPGAGQLKVASYGDGLIYSFAVTPDGSGTYDLTALAGTIQVSGNPEGLLYVPPGSALIPDYQYVLIAEYSTGVIALYRVDAAGNPLPASRLPFLTGLGGAEGACTDPVTGDLVFSTFGAGSRVIRITGFGVCGSHENYGNGIAGSNGEPTISGGGCAGRGQVTSIDVANGRPNTSGLLAVGFIRSQIPVLNGSLLVNIVNSFFHTLDSAGQWNLTLQLPTDPVWNGLEIYSQSWYLDPAAAFGISATGGLHTLVR